MLPFRYKGIILLLILFMYNAKKILDVMVHQWVKDAIQRERLRKGCDSSIMNFRDMGAFQNLLNTHVNIDLNLSVPPGVSGMLQSIYKRGLKREVQK